MREKHRVVVVQISTMKHESITIEMIRRKFLYELRVMYGFVGVANTLGGRRTLQVGIAGEEERKGNEELEMDVGKTRMELGEKERKRRKTLEGQTTRSHVEMDSVIASVRVTRRMLAGAKKVAEVLGWRILRVCGSERLARDALPKKIPQKLRS